MLNKEQLTQEEIKRIKEYVKECNMNFSERPEMTFDTACEILGRWNNAKEFLLAIGDGEEDIDEMSEEDALFEVYEYTDAVQCDNSIFIKSW